MKPELQRHAALAKKAKLIPAAQTAPTTASAVCSWSAPDSSVFSAQKPVQAHVAKRDTLDRRMVAELARITRL
jgi:hypothetical protein